MTDIWQPLTEQLLEGLKLSARVAALPRGFCRSSALSVARTRRTRRARTEEIVPLVEGVLDGEAVICTASLRTSFAIRAQSAEGTRAWASTTSGWPRAASACRPRRRRRRSPSGPASRRRHTCSAATTGALLESDWLASTLRDVL